MPDRHILLVEDDPDLVGVLAEVLQQAGYRVTTATRRAQARAALHRGGIDLIVTDSVLRGGNGDDLAKSAGQSGIPVILMSGEPDRIAALTGGPVPFLAKPFRAAALIGLVGRLLP